MRNFSPRDLRLAFPAAAALVAFSGSFACAQYYPSYPPYERSYSYDRGYDRGDDYRYERRRLLPPRDLDELPRERTYRERPVHKHKAKRHHKAPKEASRKPQHAVKGPYQIVVSLDKQSVAIYGAEGLIRRSTVSTGKRGHSTPSGVFSVLGKEYFHRSNLYSNAPMPLMQRITWSGVALHQGPQPGYPASHGCIRLSNDFAHFLWKTTKIGARVIVAHGDPSPVDVASAKLFKPVQKTPDPVSKVSSLASAAVTESKHLVSAEQAATEEANLVTASASEHDGFYKLPVTSSRKGPVSVFISRKTAKLYVRYNYEPILETPVGIEDPAEPIGTHVFTAMQVTDDGKGMRWNVISIPTLAKEAIAEKTKSSRRKMLADIAVKPVIDVRDEQTPQAALDRIDIPQETAARISELLSPGSSMMISDYGISEETGNETDFIILTR